MALACDVPLPLPVDCEVPDDVPPLALPFALPLALPLMLGAEPMLCDIEFICDCALFAAPMAAPVAVSAAPVAVPATSGGGLLLPPPALTEALADAEPDADTLLPFWLADMLADGVLADGADGVELPEPIVPSAAVAAELTADPSAPAAVFCAPPVVPGMMVLVGGAGLFTPGGF